MLVHPLGEQPLFDAGQRRQTRFDPLGQLIGARLFENIQRLAHPLRAELDNAAELSGAHVDEQSQFVDARHMGGIVAHQRPQAVEPGPDRFMGAAIAFVVALDAGEQIAALVGLGFQNGALDTGDRQQHVVGVLHPGEAVAQPHQVQEQRARDHNEQQQGRAEQERRVGGSCNRFACHRHQ